MSFTDAWHELDNCWRDAFRLAWDAYVADTIPVGAVVADAEGTVVARGQNRVFEQHASPGELANAWIAHAEVNALSKLVPAKFAYDEHTLYTTLEPCLMCFSAAVFTTIGTIRFAAVDAAGVIARELAGTERFRDRVVLEGPLHGDASLLGALPVIEFFIRRLPESRTMTKVRAAAPELVAAAQELTRRDFFSAARGMRLEQALVLLDDALAM